MSQTPKILFVCLGNICRSPLAEAAFRHQLQQVDWEAEVDSCGTGDWHCGKAPDPRAQAVAAKHGIDISRYRARQIQSRDFEHFDHIIAMDQQNLEDLRTMQPSGSRAQLSLLMDFVDGEQGRAVADPYFGDDSGFDITWQDVQRGAEALLRSWHILTN